jgi:phage-related protein (TIGR01555 family)
LSGSSSSDKPRIRVPAGSSAPRRFVTDSLVNFAANLGYGARNLLAGSSYQISPISRSHNQLEMAYRGSWLVRAIVDSVAEDMTRAGVMLTTDMTPEDEARLMEKWIELQLWQRLQGVIKWARLYGGAIGVLMIDGHNPSEPLRYEAIGRGRFQGLMVLDRWMVNPSLEDTVRDLGPAFGLPRYYDVVSDAHSVPSMRVHHSRCLRFEGVDLPYWQKIAENLWGLSVIEPMLDRMFAFDSTTMGAAQLVFKAHLRTYAVEGLRDLISGGGKAYQAFLEQMGLIRLMQQNEGMTIMDTTDKFEAYQYNFGGLSEVLVQFGQQLSGAAQIPLVRLFGQSPAGLNATGDSDIRNYYDMINSQQEAKLRGPVTALFEALHRSEFGEPLPEGFGFSFRPLWQLAEDQKASVASTITQAALQAYEAGMVGRKTVLQELKEQSKWTAVWSNITDEEIEQAEDNPPDPMAEPGEAPGIEAARVPPPHAPEREPERPEREDDADLPMRRRPIRPLNRQVIELLRGNAAATAAPMPLNGAGRNGKGEQVAALFGHRGKAAQVKAILTNDQLSLINRHGLNIVLEYERGQRRFSEGVPIPAHYGYISRTGSAEGGAEQMDCYIGDNPDAEEVYIIRQQKPDGGFDEHKVMLDFGSQQEAVNAYINAWPDQSGITRMGGVETMSIPAFKRWLAGFPYVLQTEAPNHQERTE